MDEEGAVHFSWRHCSNVECTSPEVFPPVFFNHGAATCRSNRDEVALCDLNPVGPLHLVQPGGWSLTCITREGIGVNVTLLLPQSLAVCSNPLAEFFRLP